MRSNRIIQQVEERQLQPNMRPGKDGGSGDTGDTGKPKGRLSGMLGRLGKGKAAKESPLRLPDFGPGDTVVVQVKIREGERERLQAFEGVVIGRRHRGLNSSFTVRKISHGVGVERTFQAHSPLVDNVQILRRGAVRQAKLYYLRNLAGRAARISEKLEKKAAE